MIDDQERRALREVERQCMADDPRFAREFEARQARMSSRPHRLGARLAVGAAAVLTLLLLVSGAVAGALVVAAATGVIIWAVLDHSASDRRAL